MKKEPEKVFIRSKDGYEEITFKEFLMRKESDEEYGEKKFLPLHGMLMEVSEERLCRILQTSPAGKIHSRAVDK